MGVADRALAVDVRLNGPADGNQRRRALQLLAASAVGLNHATVRLALGSKGELAEFSDDVMAALVNLAAALAYEGYDLDQMLDLGLTRAEYAQYNS